MFQIIQPKSKKLYELQELQDAFYWSGCAKLILKKHGIKCFEDANKTERRKPYSVVLRGTDSAPEIGFCEGPIETRISGQLDLQHAEMALPELTLFDDCFVPIGSLIYGRFLVKEIPKKRFQKTLPREFINEDSKWRARDIHFQYFENIPDGWKVLAYALVDDESYLPVIIESDRLIISGIPVFDLFGFDHAMPALSDGFYTTLKGAYHYPVESWLVKKMTEHAKRLDIPVECDAIWPDGFHAAMSIRHDYDRPISGERLAEILTFYSQRKIFATWFLLVDKPPDRDQINAILDCGHEIALHTISYSLDGFLDEVKRFYDLTGVFPAGFTCHGGIGSHGHLALSHNQWAIHAGMRYGEMIGRCRWAPHPLVSIKNDRPGIENLIVQNCHHSLDLNTKPDGHNLEKLQQELPGVLMDGGHVTLMNHPDIHLRELMVLLDGLALDGVWCATINNVAKLTEKIHARN